MITGLLAILCAAALLGGVSMLTDATTALQEIEAFILFLMSAVFLSGAGVVFAINDLRKEVRRTNPVHAEPPQLGLPDG